MNPKRLINMYNTDGLFGIPIACNKCNQKTPPMKVFIVNGVGGVCESCYMTLTYENDGTPRVKPQNTGGWTP